MVDTKLHDEPARLSALHRYEMLDTPREAAFDRITTLVKTVLNVPSASVSLIDADRQWLKSCAGVGDQEIAREISFCTRTIQSRDVLNVPDASEDPRFSSNPLVVGSPHIRSYLGVPLASPDGYNLGALCVFDFRPRHFDAGQVEILKSFAALVNNEMELRRIAQVDHLTGLPTRRNFCVEVDKAIAGFVRHETSAVLIVCDVDHFKRVNDTFGHPVGDQVLQRVGKEFAASIRTNDSAGRLGGEEFGILLTMANREQGIETAERLRSSLESAVFAHDPSFRVTASFGIAELEASCLSFEDWLAKADAALYEAKRGGRNCWRVAEAA